MYCIKDIRIQLDGTGKWIPMLPDTVDATQHTFDGVLAGSYIQFSCGKNAGIIKKLMETGMIKVVD